MLGLISLSTGDFDRRRFCSYMAWSAFTINSPIDVQLLGSKRARPKLREIS